MYTLPQTFARRELSISESEFAFLGIPFDSSESYRTGSRFAPNAVRVASRDLEDYDMEEGVDLLDLKICDLGDVEVSFGNFKETLKRTKATVKGILDHNVAPVCVGGEHTITYIISQAMDNDVFYLIYDAHLDYREDYLGNKHSHASVIRRLSEKVGIENILLLGVRSASKEELEKAKEDNLKFITAGEFRETKRTLKKISDLTRGKKVYLSLDIDVFDPSEARGACNPEPGGLHYTEVVKSLSFLKDCKLAGMDISELSPGYDSYSSILAAKLILKALAIFKG